MDTKALRQKILDLAIHGKLVPQDPNDEPASALLQRIHEEKERLIKEGKIKKGKKSAKTSDTAHYENGPFEVPESWEWCRLEDFSYDLIYGTSEKSTCTGLVPVLRMGNINREGKVDWHNLVYTNNKDDIEKYALQNNDLLFNRTNSSEWVGKTAIFKGNTCAIYAGYIIRVRTIIVAPDYINYVMNSLYHRSWCNEVKTDAVNQSNINAQKLSKFRIPLPPLAEQRRIVKEIEHWFSLTDIIESGKASLQFAVKQAKSKILDLAIHGKLVPQYPADEPASELLKRINPKAEITSDNAHYQNLPSGWAVTTLSVMCDSINGLWKGKKEPFIHVGVIRNANFTKDFKLDYTNIEYIDVEERAFAKRHLLNGDLIVEKSGGSDNNPVGRAILYEGKDSVYSYSNFTMALRIRHKEVLSSKYLYYHIMAKYQKGEMRLMQTQTTGLHNLILDKYLTMPLFLPPFEEQVRIVNAINKAFTTLDAIVDYL